MDPGATRLLVLGASGMLGWTATRLLDDEDGVEVIATVRDRGALPPDLAGRLGPRLVTLDVTNAPERQRLINDLQPDFVLNCVGVIKQDPRVNDLAPTVQINSLLPHLLANECDQVGARLIQVSTDCVFSGRAGSYTEADTPDPTDFYGRSKLVGELDERHLTLRTSIIGPELHRRASLVEWFLGQDGQVVDGYRRAIYSGVTTAEFTRFVHKFVLPNRGLKGLCHLASQPISKYDLLGLVAEHYTWHGQLKPTDDVVCDRSLRSDRLRDATGYVAPAWPLMVEDMAKDQRSAQRSMGGSQK